MTERPRLVLSEWHKGELLNYECSLCGRKFLLPEDRNRKEAAAEIMAAFNDHLREEHPEEQ
jgi:hypothetical protein